MKKIDQLFVEYGASHRNHTNKSIHWVCVPLIFWSIMGFISLIPTPHFCLAYYGCISIATISAIVLVSIFYFRLSPIIAVIMLLIMFLMAHLVYGIHVYFGKNAWMVFLGVFIITWIFQFIGHKIEGKKPSFLKDLQFLLVGPAWLLHFILKNLRIKY